MRFVRLKFKSSGDWMWVNPDKVRFVVQDRGNGCMIGFDDAPDGRRIKGMAVEGTAFEVVRQLEGRDENI